MGKLLVILMFATMSCTKEDAVLSGVAFGSKVETTSEKDALYQEGVKVKITKVEDSRCPKNVTCVWMGSVKIYLTVSKLGNSKDVVMEVMADYSKPTPATVELGNQKYVIDISEVLPYPENAGEIKLKDYKVSLTVKKV